MLNIGQFFEGVGEGLESDYEKGIDVAGPEDFDDLIGAAADARTPRLMLSKLSSARPTRGLGSKMAATVKRLSRIAKQVQIQSGRIEAEYLRKPNNLCSIYTTSLAPAATVAFSIQPGSGMSYYRLLGMVCTDDQANLFSFTSLKVGGVEHVNQSQTTPAAPVTNAVTWGTFQLKEERGFANLAPWSGQLFDNNTPISGTVANITVAATTDAFTGAARMALLTQVDPCGMRYQQNLQANSRMWGSLRQNLAAYAPLLAGE